MDISDLVGRFAIQKIVNDILKVKILTAPIYYEDGSKEVKTRDMSLTEDKFHYSIDDLEQVSNELLEEHFDYHTYDNELLLLDHISRYQFVIGSIKNWYNDYFYHKTSNIDSPIYFVEYNEKYAVIPHPDISKYGFILLR